MNDFVVSVEAHCSPDDRLVGERVVFDAHVEGLCAVVLVDVFGHLDACVSTQKLAGRARGAVCLFGGAFDDRVPPLIAVIAGDGSVVVLKCVERAINARRTSLNRLVTSRFAVGAQERCTRAVGSLDAILARRLTSRVLVKSTWTVTARDLSYGRSKLTQKT